MQDVCVQPIWILKSVDGYKFVCGCGEETKRLRPTYTQAAVQGTRHVRTVHHASAEIVP